MEMTDEQVCETVEKYGANREECARLNASLSCLRNVHMSGEQALGPGMWRLVPRTAAMVPRHPVPATAGQDETVNPGGQMWHAGRGSMDLGFGGRKTPTRAVFGFELLPQDGLLRFRVSGAG